MRILYKCIFSFFLSVIFISCNSELENNLQRIESKLVHADSLKKNGNVAEAFRELINIAEMECDTSAISCKVKALASIADLYKSNYNNVKAVDYLEEACEFLDLCDTCDSISFGVYLKLADLYGKLTEYNSADSVFNMILSRYSDSLYRAKVYAEKAAVDVMRDSVDFQSIISMLYFIRDTDCSLLTIEHLAVLSYSLAATQNYAESGIYMAQAESMVCDQMSEMTVLYWKYRTNLLERDFESALDNYTRMSFIKNRMIGEAMNESLQSSMYGYLDSVADFANYRLVSLRKNIILMLFLFIIVLILLALILARIVRKHRAYEEEQKDNIRELVVNIDNLKTEFSGAYFSSSIFNLFNDIVSIYYDNKDYKPDFLKYKIDTLLDAIIHDDSFHFEIEANLDRNKDRIMEKFRSSFPGMKEDDYLFAIYVFAGLSNKVISLMTDKSIDNVYRIKYRLKNKILNSDSPFKDLFLSSMKSDLKNRNSNI